MTHNKEEIILNEIIEEALQILSKKIKKNKLDLKSVKDIIEQRRIDLGNLPELAEVKESSYLHVSDKAAINPDNKITWENACKSIKLLPHEVTVLPFKGTTPEWIYSRSCILMDADVGGNHRTQIRSVKYDDDADAFFNILVEKKDSSNNFNTTQSFRFHANGDILSGSQKFATQKYVTDNLALKANIASPALTGTPTAPTAAVATNSTQIATTAFVKGQDYASNTSLNLKANIASPALTGTPTAPTAAVATNSTQIATTAFVKAQDYTTKSYVDTGLIRKKDLGASIDLNDIIETGWYAQNTTSSAVSGKNYPAPLAGILKVFYKVSSQITQTYTTLYNSTALEVYVRNYYSGTWGPWVAMINTDSPKFTGIPTAPTAAVATNSTQIATTAFVKAQDYASNTAVKGTSSFAENGYTKLPSGFIMQWGWQPKPGGESRSKFAFPIAFPNKCLSANAIIFNNVLNNLHRCDYWVQLISFTSTHVEFYMQGSGTLYEPSRYYWQAMGH